MLVLERRNGESLKIFPSENLPHDMTVEELFSQGPLEIMLSRGYKGKARIGVKAPAELIIRREELL